MTAVPKIIDIGLPGINVSSEEMSTVIKRTLAQDLNDTKLSRESIAIALSKLAARTITEAQLDAYTAESKLGHRFPVELIAPWVSVTGSARLLKLLGEWTGRHLVDDAELRFAEFGRAQIQQEKSEVKLKALKGELWHRVP